jgi:hypothetical protein
MDNEGQVVGIKDLFDATHMRETADGKIYVNEKARLLAVYLCHLPYPYFFSSIIYASFDAPCNCH